MTYPFNKNLPLGNNPYVVEETFRHIAGKMCLAENLIFSHLLSHLNDVCSLNATHLGYRYFKYLCRGNIK